MAASEDERQLARQKLAEAERAEAELREREVRVFKFHDFNQLDTNTINEIIKVAAIAKQASRETISVTVRNEQGQPVQLTERVGHETEIMIFVLQARLAALAQQGSR